MTKDPFKRTETIPNGLVHVWVERVQYVRVGRRTALSYLQTRLGVKEGWKAYKTGFFLVDTLDDANQCVAELKAVKDDMVSQFVFGARAFSAQN